MTEKTETEEQVDPRELARWLRRHGPLGPEAAEPLLVRDADGAWVETVRGERLLDFSTGGLVPLGHRFAAGTGGLQFCIGPGQEQVDRVRLMRKLAVLVPGSPNRRVLLCDSGREALARAVSLARAATGRERVVYLGELAGERVEFGNDVAAVVAHPFDSRLVRAKEFCHDSGALLVDDESGIGPGMSGRMFAVEWSQVRPDVFVLGRGLAAGYPFGACVTGSSALRWKSVPAGGGPAGCVAALEFLRLLEQGLLERANALGAYLGGKLEMLVGKGFVKQVPGAGLSLALRLEQSGRAAGLVLGSRESGLLLVRAGERTVGVQPSLAVAEGDIDRAVGIIGGVLERMNRC